MYLAMVSSPVVPGPYMGPSHSQVERETAGSTPPEQRVALLTRVTLLIVIKVTMTSMSTAAGHVSRMITTYFAMVPSSHWFFGPR
jgi:hypothetical protein